MQTRIIASLFLLALSGCTEKQAKEQAKEPTGHTAPELVAITTDTFYVHCSGRDFHLRRYQPAYAVSFMIEVGMQAKVSEFNSAARGYLPICDTLTTRCDNSVNSRRIEIDKTDEMGEHIVSTKVSIDRSTGEFQASTITRSPTYRVTNLRAAGRCDRSTEPIPPSQI